MKSNGIVIEMKILIFVLATLAGLINSQFVNNVHLMGHTQYMINIIQEVVTELEHREWCSLKVPDIEVALNETVLDNHYEGTVTYSNGFANSMQWIDIRQSGISQIWSWNTTDETGTVRLTGTLRMLDLELGYDVVADLQDGHRRYTVAVTYPLVLFTFDIRKNVNTEEVQVEVEGSISTTARINNIKFMPQDNTTDVLTTLFNVALPGQGIVAWGTNVFPSIALDAYHKIEFPRICYDCPLAAT